MSAAESILINAPFGHPRPRRRRRAPVSAAAAPAASTGQRTPRPLRSCSLREPEARYRALGGSRAGWGPARPCTRPACTYIIFVVNPFYFPLPADAYAAAAVPLSHHHHANYSASALSGACVSLNSVGLRFLDGGANARALWGAGGVGRVHVDGVGEWMLRGCSVVVAEEGRKRVRAVGGRRVGEAVVEMVAKVEDCFLGREHGFVGGSYHSKLLGPWAGVREGDALHASSFFGASRSGDLPTTWMSHQSPHDHHAVLGGGGGGYYSKAELQQNVVVQPSQRGSVRLNAIAVLEPVTSTTFASSYLMPGAAVPVSAAAQLGRANPLAPGGLARNPSFESITSGSCSTPSFCVGSPVTVPTRPSDSGTKDSDALTLGPAFCDSSRVGPHPQLQPQLSDHYLSTDSLSYGSMEERDAIVNCVDDFWSSPHMVVGELPLPEFRFEPMLDDTAMSFSVGELDSLVSPNHGPRQAQRGSLASMIQLAPDQSFCQAFFAGADDGDKAPIASSSTTHGSKPAQLAIPAKVVNSSADHSGGARLRWSDQPWSGPPPHKSSSPSSPTTPLDPHLFATQTPSDALRADEIQKKLTEFSSATSNSNTNKRSFAAMAGETKESSPPNADKFDAAALSALLYNNTQSNPEFRSAYASAPQAAAPKQRRRHGTATDPQSIAARTRREKFTDRIRVLQSLVPNGERLDTVHMLSQTFEYVRFLQHKVWDLYNGKDSIAEVQCEKWKEFVDTATGQVIV